VPVAELKPWTRVNVRLYVFSLSAPVEKQRNVQNNEKNAFLINDGSPDVSQVVQVKVMEANAKVGDSTGCLDLRLKNE
jgi:hypothetical protein